MFLINEKHCVYRPKISSDSENLIALILVNSICGSRKIRLGKFLPINRPPPPPPPYPPGKFSTRKLPNGLFSPI